LCCDVMCDPIINFLICQNNHSECVHSSVGFERMMITIDVSLIRPDRNLYFKRRHRDGRSTRAWDFLKKWKKPRDSMESAGRPASIPSSKSVWYPRPRFRFRVVSQWSFDSSLADGRGQGVPKAVNISR
jgi:hypothetical protein